MEVVSVLRSREGQRYSMNMIGSVIGALVVGLISVFAIVISQGIISGQSTAGWPSVLTSIVTNIAPVIGIVGIIAMFIIVVRLAGGFGGATGGGL